MRLELILELLRHRDVERSSGVLAAGTANDHHLRASICGPCGDGKHAVEVSERRSTTPFYWWLSCLGIQYPSFVFMILRRCDVITILLMAHTLYQNRFFFSGSMRGVAVAKELGERTKPMSTGLDNSVLWKETRCLASPRHGMLERGFPDGSMRGLLEFILYTSAS